MKYRGSCASWHQHHSVACVCLVPLGGRVGWLTSHIQQIQVSSSPLFLAALSCQMKQTQEKNECDKPQLASARTIDLPAPTPFVLFRDTGEECDECLNIYWDRVVERWFYTHGIPHVSLTYNEKGTQQSSDFDILSDIFPQFFYQCVRYIINWRKWYLLFFKGTGEGLGDDYASDAH